MKKSLLVLFAASSTVMFAQEVISFEASEGYNMSSIHGQNNWAAHPEDESDVAVSQVVTDEEFTDGAYALKLSQESSASTSAPINTFYTLNEALPATDFVISFDVKINEQVSDYNTRTANFYFSNSESPFYSSTVYQIQMLNNGEIKIVKGMSAGYPSYLTLDQTWTAGEWYRIKIMGTAEGLEFFINGDSVATLEHINGTDNMVENLYFRRNNYDNSATDYGFIDRIAINSEESLATDNVVIENKKVSLYPNPVKNILNIKTKQNVQAISIYDMSGKVVRKYTNQDTLDLSTLKKGVYVISIQTDKGVESQKLIKK